MPFRVKLADKVRTKLRFLPKTWSERLAERMRELADLAEIHPISRAHEGPVPMQLMVDGLQVQYEVDRDRRQLTVTELAASQAGNDEDSGSFNVA